MKLMTVAGLGMMVMAGVSGVDAFGIDVPRIEASLNTAIAYALFGMVFIGIGTSGPPQAPPPKRHSRH